MLATKYRPKTFADVVGQRSSVLVLSKAIERDMVPASLVLSGMRGTGKTSMARIFARALNPTEDNEALFLWEVDAASSGGVDSMRTLIEDVRYSSPFHRVIVLDEVHAATQAGFQVLLKTLEEPPPRVTFVLVTTEPNKIPDTILGRSMQCRFGKITDADIKARLEFVAESEGIETEDQTLARIVEAADGGMRDALMLLDQAALMGDGRVTADVLDQIAGGRSAVPFLEAVGQGNLYLSIIEADKLSAALGALAATDQMILEFREVFLGRRQVRGWKAADAFEAIPKLWRMAEQIKRLGPDDRAAMCALAAELCRGFGGSKDFLSSKEISKVYSSA